MRPICCAIMWIRLSIALCRTRETWLLRQVCLVDTINSVTALTSTTKYELCRSTSKAKKKLTGTELKRWIAIVVLFGRFNLCLCVISRLVCAIQSLGRAESEAEPLERWKDALRELGGFETVASQVEFGRVESRWVDLNERPLRCRTKVVLPDAQISLGAQLN